MAKSKTQKKVGKYEVDTETGDVKLSKKIFKLEDYKKKKGFGNNTKFKPLSWLPLSDAFQEVTGIPGFPMGHITILRGHSDSSKTTALLEGAISAQKKGILPVFIITEMKWSWEHARQMGLEFEDEVDEDTGEVVGKKGFFVYIDRSDLNSIEDVAKFITDMIKDQESGNLDFDLAFFWDSVGSIPCDMSIEKGKNNNEWNAGAMSVQFGNHVNQKITASRKDSYPYTNTLVCVNKVWTRKPESPMGRPKMECKGGTTMYYDATLVVDFGNISGSGAQKVKATKNKKDVTFGSRVKIKISKNHVNGVSTESRIMVTPTGYIHDTKSALDNYKKDHMDYFASILGKEAYEGMETIYEDADDDDSFSSQPDEDFDKM